jgi:hypothetical protein
MKVKDGKRLKLQKGEAFFVKWFKSVYPFAREKAYKRLRVLHLSFSYYLSTVILFFTLQLAIRPLIRGISILLFVAEQQQNNQYINKGNIW